MKFNTKQATCGDRDTPVIARSPVRKSIDALDVLQFSLLFSDYECRADKAPLGDNINVILLVVFSSWENRVVCFHVVLTQHSLEQKVSRFKNTRRIETSG